MPLAIKHITAYILYKQYRINCYYVQFEHVSIILIKSGAVTMPSKPDLSENNTGLMSM